MMFWFCFVFMDPRIFSALVQYHKWKCQGVLLITRQFPKRMNINWQELGYGVEKWRSASGLVGKWLTVFFIVSLIWSLLTKAHSKTCFGRTNRRLLLQKISLPFFSFKTYLPAHVQPSEISSHPGTALLSHTATPAFKASQAIPVVCVLTSHSDTKLSGLGFLRYWGRLWGVREAAGFTAPEITGECLSQLVDIRRNKAVGTKHNIFPPALHLPASPINLNIYCGEERQQKQTAKQQERGTCTIVPPAISKMKSFSNELVSVS